MVTHFIFEKWIATARPTQGREMSYCTIDIPEFPGKP